MSRDPMSTSVHTTSEASAGTTRGFGRRRFLIATKIAISAALLAWILSRADVGEVLAALASASIPLLLVAYALDYVGLFISSVRWRALLRAQGVETTRWFVIESYLVAFFFNNFLPSTVGGDTSRAYDSYRAASGTVDAVTSVVVDRLLGLLALVAFAVGGMPFARQLTGQIPHLAIWVAAVGGGLLAFVWAVFASSPATVQRLLGYLPSALERPAERVSRAFSAYQGKHRVLAIAIGLSVLLQANVILAYVLISTSLGLPVPAISFFVIVPLATLVMMLPITINGIGLRENVLAVFLAVYGVGNSEAVAFAWLLYLGSLIQGVLGGVVYAMRR